MDMKLELVAVPVTDVDESIKFYKNLGFNLDHDHKVSPDLRFVQMTPKGSACSIAFGTGISDMKPGSLQGLQVVVDDIEEAKEFLELHDVENSGIQVFPWGKFIFFKDPDGNGWAIQQLPEKDD